MGRPAETLKSRKISTGHFQRIIVASSLVKSTGIMWNGSAGRMLLMYDYDKGAMNGRPKATHGYSCPFQSILDTHLSLIP